MITELPQKNPKFQCVSCCFITSNKKDYSRHLLTAKHKELTKMVTNDNINPNVTPIYEQSKFVCKCGNIYTYNSGLSRHKKTCQMEIVVEQDNDNKKDNLIEYLIKENSEFKGLIMELIKKETINNTTYNNVNSNNINNNSFNLNLFLNEKCKDAINMNEFVDNIKMQLSDLENFGHLGYVEGITNILINNLKDLDTYSRPIHCSDFKREVLYVKENNQWTKETDDKPLLKNAIRQVANKNIKQIQTWKANHPDCIYSDSKKNDQYNSIVMNSMSGGSSEEQQRNISQIVKNVSKVVVIDKNTEKF